MAIRLLCRVTLCAYFSCKARNANGGVHYRAGTATELKISAPDGIRYQDLRSELSAKFRRRNWQICVGLLKRPINRYYYNYY